MTKEEQSRIEARLQAFDRSMDELWRVLHDPYLLTRHLAELLRRAGDEGGLIAATVVGVAAYFWEAIT